MLKDRQKESPKNTKDRHTITNLNPYLKAELKASMKVKKGKNG